MSCDLPQRRDGRALERLAGAFPWLPPLEIGVGWAALAWDLAEDIEDLAGRGALLRGAVIRVVEVRSKDGELLFAYRGAPAGHVGEVPKFVRLEAAIARAEGRAMNTCELCGRPGATAVRKGGWRFTLCPGHRAAEGRR